MPAEATECCPLCGRTMAEPCNAHHLIPLSKGGRNTETILLHKVCHDKIHAVFSETELKRYYHTIPRLLEHEEIRKFVQWLRNKPPAFYDRSVKARKRR